VLAGRFLNLKLYESLVGAGAVGVVAGGIGVEDYREILKKPVPVSVLGGFGVIPVPNIVLDLFEKYPDTSVLIKPDQKHNNKNNNYDDAKMKVLKMQSGSIFVYPRGEGEELVKKASEGDLGYPREDDTAVLASVRVGDKVQIWDPPFWGYSGQVSDVLEDEGLLNVKLVSGRKALVEPELVRIIGN
jgi:hypothetical protein